MISKPKYLAALFLVFFFISGINHCVGQDLEISLYKFQELYEKGNLKEIIAELQPILEGDLSDLDRYEKTEGWRILTLCHMHLLNYKKADDAMMAFMLLNPKYEPNPIRDTPEFVALLYSFEVKNRVFWKTVRKKKD